MAKTIPKLNKLNNPESFIQVNTIKGFKYIDKAGEIVNSYHVNNTPPKFAMNLGGLVIENPVEKVDQLKITSQTFWMKFSEIDSLDMIMNIYSKEIKKVIEILEVEKTSRVGWRNYFVYEFASQEKQDKYLERFSIVDKTKPKLIQMEVTTGEDFNASLIMQPVIKNDENKTLGVLFDIDIFKTSEIEIGDIGVWLKKFKKYLSEENGFLSLINNTFE